jgi:TRAP-type mannitol/chloroaromatic compound transport system substrate-binding protein
MERRRFVLKAGGILAAAGAVTTVDAPNVIAQPKFQWRMSTTWSPALNKKAYDALPVDLQRTLDHALAATQEYGLMEYETKNAIAFEKLKTEFKGKVEILQLPAPLLRDLKKLAAEVLKEESEKSPMAKKVHASLTKFQAQLAGWSRVSEGAYHQLVAL